MKRLADIMQVIPTSLIDIYIYYKSVLIHMTKDILKSFEKHLLHSKRKVVMSTGKNKWYNKATIVNNRADANQTQKITKFSIQTGDDFVHRIYIRFHSDVKKLNQPIKIDLLNFANR